MVTEAIIHGIVSYLEPSSVTAYNHSYINNSNTSIVTNIRIEKIIDTSNNKSNLFSNNHNDKYYIQNDELMKQELENLRTYQKIRDILVSYEDLDEGWDGYDAEKPDETIIKQAKIFLNNLYKYGFELPKPMISSDGEISFYWKKDANYIEISIDDNETFSYYAKVNDKEIDGEELSLKQNIPYELDDIIKKI